MVTESGRRHDRPPLEVRVRVRYVSGNQGRAVAAAQGAALRVLVNGLDSVSLGPEGGAPRKGMHPDHSGS
jgi:hypothetical protein